MLLLSDADRESALALDGAAPFDPMGNGRVMNDKIMLPEDTFHDPIELRESGSPGPSSTSPHCPES